MTTSSTMVASRVPSPWRRARGWVNDACRRRRAAMVALLASIVLSGCQFAPRGAAEPTWPPAGGSDSVSLEATPILTRPAGQYFGDTHHYPHGLDVRVVEIRTVVLGWLPTTSVEAETSELCTIIRVQLHNKSHTGVKAEFAAEMLYGPELKEAGTVAVDEPTGTFVIGPGRLTSHDFGFTIPVDFIDDVAFELSVDNKQREKAYFVGSVRTS